MQLWLCEAGATEFFSERLIDRARGITIADTTVPVVEALPSFGDAASREVHRVAMFSATRPVVCVQSVLAAAHCLH